MPTGFDVRIQPWGTDGLPLLELLLGDPSMMRHLGGPESLEKIADRQRRYEQPDSHQFTAILERTGEAVGWVGYWERTWHDHRVFEIGWSVLPAFHGRGIAGRAAGAALQHAAAEPDRSYVHAFPGVHNHASNAVCRKVGFVLLGAIDFEYPPGTMMRCNDWQFDLAGLRDRVVS
ncbi:MAG: GNAT family N-acetyltransferase [Solirubrobacteraceae bacterium]